MYVDFSLYFFATSAVVLLPFVYCVWKKLAVLALFILANGYLTGLFFFENDPTAGYTLFLALGGAVFFFFEAIRQSEQNTAGEVESQQSEEAGEPDPRMHPKIKPMRHLLPANIKDRIIKCLKCGGENEVPKTAQSAICQYCHKDALSPA